MNSSEPTIEVEESSVVEAVDHQTSTEVDDEKVILNLEAGRYYGLDPIGAQIWSQIQEPTQVEEIATSIASEYDVKYERCVHDVVSLLSDLKANRLITVAQK